MADKATNVVDLTGSNIGALKDLVRRAAAEYAGLKEKRTSINEKCAAIREEVAAAGVPKAAFTMAMLDLERTNEQRHARDVGYEIARDALGSPFGAQLELDVDAAADA